jgi:hypothetical protein
VEFYAQGGTVSSIFSVQPSAFSPMQLLIAEC